MAVSRALRRLLRVLDLEEEQRRTALESAQGGLARLERSMKAAKERGQGGRRLFSSSARSGELPDRLAGIEEARAGERYAKVLAPRIADQEVAVVAQREAYLAKRVERRQAETLIAKTESEEAIVSGLRGQQSLDDWYLNRRHAGKSGSIAEAPSTTIDLPFSTRMPADET